MNIKTRIAKFLITLTTFSVMTTVNAYQGNDCCNPCSYNPCCPSTNRSYFVGADYIYWSVHQDGLQFVQESSCNNSCGCEGSSSSSSKCQDFDNWNSGFKIGAGMANPCCDWDLFVQYTYYQTNPHRHHNNSNGNALLSLWADLFGTTVLGAHSQWKLNFNNIDALISNEFCVNNCFTFRPSFGLKGAWINQHNRVEYDFTPFDSSADNFYQIRHKQDFWGVGPKVAITASATVFDCFSLFGNLGLSTLWSHYDVKRHDATGISTVSDCECDTSSAETEVFCFKHCRHRVNPVLETSFGVRWDTELCCGDYGFYVQVAWEQQVWFDHNDFIHLLVNHSHGNLTLQGVTAGVGVSF